MDLLTGILWLTLNVYHEARNQDPKAQMAVAHVTLNRVKKSGKSVRQVVFQPKQFSWTHQKTVLGYVPRDSKAFFKCLGSAIKAHQSKDFTKGSTYYHRKDIKVYWASVMKKTGRHGDHIFYKEKG